MSLNLYRRHRRDCSAGHAEESRSGELEERKKNWKRCNCPIFASGTLRKRFRRQTTGQWEWGEAKAIAGQWETKRSWTGEVTVPELLPEPAKSQRTTIERAVEVFLAELRETAAIATHRKYRLLLKKFKAFSEQRG